MAHRAPAVIVPWALFLRAVNVSGTGLLKMEALRAALSAAGFADVRTLLASGNVMLRSDLPRAEIQHKAEAIVSALVGRPTPVIVRAPGELAAHLAAAAPYEATLPERGTLALGLLDHAPEPAGLLRLAAFDARGDEAIPVGDVVILRYVNGTGATLLSNDRLERLLGVRATGRNLNTVRKVLVALGPS